MNILTSHSNSTQLVLQITPELNAGDILIAGQKYRRTASFVYIPKNNPYYTHCPLNYFQESVSLPGKWILDDSNSKLKLDFIDNLNEVVITELANGVENLITRPSIFLSRLLDYFKLDICHNLITYKGFDCYAFISLIANVKYFPKNPEFTYEEKEHSAGDIVVFAENNSLPDSIKHWAIYLGKGYYLSKFGRSGEGASSLLSVTDLEGMKFLYKSNSVFVANPKANARQWDGYIPN